MQNTLAAVSLWCLLRDIMWTMLLLIGPFWWKWSGITGLRNDRPLLKDTGTHCGRDVGFFLALVRLCALRLWVRRVELQKLLRHFKRGSAGGWRFALEPEVREGHGGNGCRSGEQTKPGRGWGSRIFKECPENYTWITRLINLLHFPFDIE